ncbi:hypothetical protein ACFY04_37780 [Streptomyces sp. NPDC001549]|uniref:hypothetical protein n=1 Tax=Streptomyces sp. NPDC001549 TaxID=3364586 RepID=UPI0036D04BA9
MAHANHGKPPDKDRCTSRDRLKRNRAVTTRFDTLAVRFEATVHIAAINEWL